MNKIIITILFFLASVTLAAQRISVEEYIAQFKDIAISEMKRSGVPASITLAQGILETENGNSELVKKSNNHFGIKCKSTWTGESVTHDDDANGECFRAYTSANESYKDHSDFLKANKRYSALFNLDPADYAGWARGLKKAGYATNPRYPDLLIKYIEQYDLQQYSLIALDRLPGSDMVITNDNKGPAPVEVVNDNPIPGNDISAAENDLAKITSVNTIKCIFAKRGTSLLVIANKHNISLSKLMEFNDMAEEGLLTKDQLIYLEKKAKSGEQEYYILQQGETLYDAAQKNAVQLKYLMEYNHVKADATLYPKTKLFLQPAGVQKEVKSAVGEKAKVHQVGPKEGLYSIARTYNVTVQQLKEWNKLDTDNLKIGQEIIVSK
ncbi:MAG: LysM peptidoglycan-binding domain-containing protein [Chitinophagaceae bacterium]|nr:LysM peptidoglycan-binding domain-containing protein [Chitinophagaceae bacterium]